MKSDELLIRLAATSEPLKLLEKKERMIRRIKKEMRKEMKIKLKAKNFRKAAIFPITLLILLITIFSFFSNTSKNYAVTGVISFLLSLALVVVALLTFKITVASIIVISVGGILFWLTYIILNNKIDKHSLLSKTMNLPEFADSWSQIDEIKAEIELLKSDSWYTSNLEFLHENYHDTTSVNHLYAIVDEGRAETLSEALNCLKKDRHYEKMENYQQSILDETQQLAMSAAASAYYARTARMYNNSNFYNN